MKSRTKLYVPLFFAFAWSLSAIGQVSQSIVKSYHPYVASSYAKGRYLGYPISTIKSENYLGIADKKPIYMANSLAKDSTSSLEYLEQKRTNKLIIFGLTSFCATFFTGMLYATVPKNIDSSYGYGNNTPHDNTTFRTDVLYVTGPIEVVSLLYLARVIVLTRKINKLKKEGDKRLSMYPTYNPRTSQVGLTLNFKIGSH